MPALHILHNPASKEGKGRKERERQKSKSWDGRREREREEGMHREAREGTVKYAST